MNPLQLAFYKGVTGKQGAVQFNFQRPHYYLKTNSKYKNYEGKFIPKHWQDELGAAASADNLTSREGALFLEITSAVGPNQYDWEQKVIMALSIHDLGKILTVLSGQAKEVTIMHDPHAKSASAGKVKKYLTFSSPKGLAAGIMVTANQSTEAQEKISHTVGLSGSEVHVLTACIRSVIPNALAWS